MVRFDPRKTDQDATFESQFTRLSALVADMKKIRSGMLPEQLAENTPILDQWVVAHRLIPCLAGLSTGHPRLPGENRAISTSDLWLLSEDGEWARTLSRWYRLGCPAESSRRDS